MSIQIDRKRLAADLDAALAQSVSGAGRLPGVVAGVTTRDRTVYLGAAGVRALDDPPAHNTAIATDAVFAAFSTTKSVTAAVALKLAEKGWLDLDAPASEYEPRLADITVLEGIDDDGTPRVRPAASAPTTRQLLTHTSGFGYDFFDENLYRLAQAGKPDVSTATFASIDTPLIFDPGTRWQYGTGVDWAGLVIEGVTGQRLGAVMSDHIFSPLGMSDTDFTLTADMRDRRATMHHRRPDGTLRANHKFAPPADPEIHMGGHGLYTTVSDYLRFLRMWLSGGLSDSGDQVLRPETVAGAMRNQIGDLPVTPLRGVNRRVADDLEFFPGVRRSWGLSFLRFDESTPTGRAPDSVSWAGLANLYFWIDPATGIAGYWATQVFPFADPATLGHYLDFESTVYRSING